MSNFAVVKLLDPAVQIKVNIVPTGAYDNARTYAIAESVSYSGSSYVAIAVTTGNLPTNTTYWQLLASGSSSGAVYEFTQSSPAITWTVNHNLGFKPVVSTYSVGGVEFEAEVVHISINQCQILFNSATAGYARFV